MRRSKTWLWSALAIICGALVLSYPATYRVGVDGKLYTKKIPLYAKTAGFLYRDWMYRDIAAEAAGREKDDLGKALALLRWTNSNISLGAPPGLKIVDDHPLNIIIRQFGADDQIEDVFTILCAYCGMRAGRQKCRNRDKTDCIILSFVNIGGEWKIFKAAKNRYFPNRDGGVGSVEDYLKGGLVVTDEIERADGIRYGDYLENLRGLDFSRFTRAEEQMPLLRPAAQLKKFFGSRHKKPAEVF
jgi:hypothetical protein